MDNKAVTTFDQLYKHIKRARIEPIQEYLNQGGDPNLQQGWTLLMTAAHFGTTKILVLLLNHGARLEVEAGEGLTALALAASAGRTGCVRALIDRGASVNVRPHGAPLSTYMTSCGGPYPQIDKLIAEARRCSETR